MPDGKAPFWTVGGNRLKLAVLVVITAVTVATHYGWMTEQLFGHVHWIHALHSRFCYIPIVIAASWFGLRGGLYAAATITALILPFVLSSTDDAHDFTSELVEIFFYFAIGMLTGGLIDREAQARTSEQKAQLHLERSQRLSLLGQMAASVAHEIKNPLASIKGAFEIVSDDSNAKADRDEFRQIGFREIKRIDSTVAEFLEFARPKETHKDRVDFSALLESSVRQVQPQVSQHKLKLAVHLEPGAMVLADPEKIHQAVLNVLLNAIEASGDGDTLTVDLEKRAGTGAVLRIADTGSGMSPEEIAQAFDPFYTTKASGTGLGLAIVKSIIDNHDGQIDLQSEPGKGTHVRIVLPFAGGEA